MIPDKAPKNRSRIVFILPGLTAGGAERVLITLMNGLDPERFERMFITVNEAGPLRDLIDPAVPFISLGADLRVSRGLPALLHELRRLKPDIVISTMAHMNYGLLLLKPFLSGTRFVVREAITPSFFLQRGGAQALLVRIAYRLLYPLADLVISPAQLIVDEFRALGVPVKNHIVLPNPVDSEKIRGGVVAPERKENAVNFIAAGRLHPQKGFDRLIELLPRFRPGDNWTLTILGEGAQRMALEDMIDKKGLRHHVRLAGYVPEPWPHIAAADAFLMPSRHEGLPNAVLEALACGTPVIVTSESGGIGEIARQAAPGAVTMVDTMDEFLTAMATFRPRPEKAQRVSLLPPHYDRGAVVEKFSTLLRNLKPDLR